MTTTRNKPACRKSRPFPSASCPQTGPPCSLGALSFQISKIHQWMVEEGDSGGDGCLEGPGGAGRREPMRNRIKIKRKKKLIPQFFSAEGERTCSFLSLSFSPLLFSYSLCQSLPPSPPHSHPQQHSPFVQSFTFIRSHCFFLPFFLRHFPENAT